MRLAMIFAVGPVRHMSVRAGARMRETTDKHGQRPCGALTSMFTWCMAWEEFPVGIDDVGEASDDGKCDAGIRYEGSWLDTAGDHQRDYPPVGLLAASAGSCCCTGVVRHGARFGEQLVYVAACLGEAFHVAPQGVGGECALRVLDFADPYPPAGGVGHQQVDLSGEAGDASSFRVRYLPPQPGNPLARIAAAASSSSRWVIFCRSFCMACAVPGGSAESGYGSCPSSRGGEEFLCRVDDPRHDPQLAAGHGKGP